MNALLLQIDNFHQEIYRAAVFLYSLEGMDYYLSKNKHALDRVNQNPTFWLATRNAFQQSLHIALGRIFDDNSKNNVSSLVKTIYAHKDEFTKASLERRKLISCVTRPVWIDDYIANAHEPTEADYRQMKKAISTARKHYIKTYSKIRHKTVAHAEIVNHEDVSGLYEKTRILELKLIVAILWSVHAAIVSQYDNGKNRRQNLRDFVLSRKNFDSAHPRTHETIRRVLLECKNIFSA